MASNLGERAGGSSGEVIVGGSTVGNPQTCTELNLLSRQAVIHSVEIRHQDAYNDAVNYWLGLYGKTIVLMAIKQQGLRDNVDPETDTDCLNWDSISQEATFRAPMNMRRFTKAVCLHIWYKNRLRNYREIFPSYKRYECATDKIIRHITYQLKSMIQMKMNVNRLMWENYITSKPQPRWDSRGLHIASFNSYKGGGNARACPVGPISGASPGASGRPTPLVKKVKQGISVSTNSNRVTEDVEVNSARQAALYISRIREKQNVCIKIYAPEFDEEDSQESSKHQGNFHLVVDHNSSDTPENKSSAVAPARFSEMNQAKLIRGSKRVVSANENEERRRKRSKVNPAIIAEKNEEVRQTQLLSTLDFFKFRQSSLLRQMSWVVSKSSSLPGYSESDCNEAWTCEFSLAKIEDKIKKGEILDAKTLVWALRCLVAFYLICDGKKEIPQDIFTLRASLKRSIEQIKEPPKICEIVCGSEYLKTISGKEAGDEE